MQGDEKVRPILSRFEIVEWRYDGLNGKIIPWTKERGNTHDDPSVLAFVVSSDERVFAMCPGRSAYAASSFSKWLREQADAYERAHPRTLVPFVRGTVTGSGEERTCPELAAARRARKPVLLLFGREARDDDDRDARAEVKATRAFVKKHLQSKSTSEKAEGWVLLRFDLADADHAALAKGLGIERAPSTLMFVPGEDSATDLTAKLRTGGLAYWLKKHASK